MRLDKLLQKLPSTIKYSTVGDLSRKINSIHSDSRMVTPGDAFVAIKGLTVDGHDYVSNVIDNGVQIVVVEENKQVASDKVTAIIVEDTKEFIGYLVSAFYDNPSSKVKLIGVTGTNGKSTIVTLLFNLFRKLGHKVGLISTIENRINDQVKASKFTTPDAVALTRLLSEMVDADCTYVFMEVSSHALSQGRVNGQRYSGAVFTNLTHDHLDYHKDFKEYLYMKKRLFDGLDDEAFALTNVDDKNGAVMIQNCKADKYRYSLKTLVDYKAKLLRSDIDGMLLSINDQEVYSRLVGEFNAYNVLTVYATAIILDEDELEVLKVLSNLKAAEGRFEVVRDENTNKVGIVDYAHTPDALKNVLETLNKIRGDKELITVVGCGGDRDVKKRPVMARIASEYSDKVILTSDNPRSEDPDTIINEMYAGLDGQNSKRVLKISDRREAIKTAIMIANEKAIILVAGKGHEKTQEFQGKKFPFDDKLVLKAFLREE